LDKRKVRPKRGRESQKKKECDSKHRRVLVATAAVGKS
jgi:hypothetical protein